MFRTRGIGSDKRQIDIGLNRCRKCHLGLFSFLLQALQSHLVIAKIDALVTFEFIGKPGNDTHIEVLAAQECVAVCRLDFENPVANLQDGDVEGAAAQIEHGNLFLSFLVQSVSQRGCCRLVDDTLDV